MEPTRLKPIPLGVEENPPGHPCADIRHYGADLALLNYLLQDLRVLVRQAAAGDTVLDAYQTLTWHVHGLRRRTVMCDPRPLLRGSDVLIVGFLGDRRSTDEANEVDEFEIDVIAEFRQYPGILSYSSIELIDNQWANLVVHQEVEDREAWRTSLVHIQAAEELAPRVYHSVRIHNGRVHRGPIGSETVIVETSKYWDYDSDPLWHATRALPGGITETVSRPWTRSR